MYLIKISNETKIFNRKNEIKRFSNKTKTLNYISRLFKIKKNHCFSVNGFHIVCSDKSIMLMPQSKCG